MGLSDKSTSHLNQYTLLEKLFIDNPTAVGSMPAFLARRVVYGTDLGICYGYRDGANASTSGFTSAKKIAKKASSVSAAAITGKGLSYAILKGNDTLKGKMEQWTESFLNKTNDNDFAGVITNINTALFPFIASDPVVSADFFTALQLTSMLNDKTTYVSKLNLYKAAKEAINLAKNNFKTISIADMKENITFLEGFLTDLSFTFSDFVESFKIIVAKLDVIGKRNQGITASMFYLVSGLPIVLNGTFEVTNYPVVKVPKKGTTNSMGLIPLIKLKIGTWNGVFKAPNCKDQEVTMVVTSKKVVDYIIKMSPL
jgi:hypothetical protein